MAKEVIREARYDKFSQRARQVLVLSEEEARRYRHNFIGTEHLLLALVREGEGVAAKVLLSLGVELRAVRKAIEDAVAPGDRPVTGDISMTQRARKVVELAVDEARSLGHHYIGTEHLLLGVIREGQGEAARVLEKLGIPLEQAREQTMAILSGRGGDTREAVLTCRLGVGELSAIDVLIEAGIRSTRSDAASWLIRAGIESHKELFQRVSATVAEIRRLRQEAQTIAQSVITDDAPPNGED